MTVYLDNAATSLPKPPVVYDTFRACLEQYGACPGRGSHGPARQAEAALQEARDRLARLFGTDAGRIVFTLNATDALNMALKGALEAGDHVVTTVYEHNSVLRPLNRLERQGLITTTRVGGRPDGWIDPVEIRAAITPRTKLVAVVHGSNVLGSLAPVDAIGPLCRKAGVLFLVDAAQTAGAVPINVERSCIDLLAFPGHKALLGPAGTGGLCVGPAVRLRPWREGGTGARSELALQPEEMPLLLEAGSHNAVGLASLSRALAFIESTTVERIRAHELAMTARLMEGLAGIPEIACHGPGPGGARIAVISVSVAERSPEAVAAFLDEEFGVAVRAGLHCAPGAHQAAGTFPAGTVRISPGYFTTEQDIERCLDGLRQAVRACPRGARRSVTLSRGGSAKP